MHHIEQSVTNAIRNTMKIARIHAKHTWYTEKKEEVFHGGSKVNYVSRQYLLGSRSRCYLEVVRKFLRLGLSKLINPLVALILVGTIPWD